jgi:hypothetical protein
MLINKMFNETRNETRNKSFLMFVFTLALISMNVLSNDDNLLVLKCSNEYYPEEVVFIWGRTSNSLIGTTIEETNGIPYKSNEPLETIFEKVPPEISGATPKFTYIFKEYVNTLHVIRDWTEVKLEDPDGWIQYRVTDFNCKVIEDNR